MPWLRPGSLRATAVPALAGNAVASVRLVGHKHDHLRQHIGAVLTDRSKEAKRLANAIHAAKYRRKDRKQRRAQRHARVEARNLDWLVAMGITRDPSVPLA